MNSLFNSFITEVNRGRKGYNTGLSNGFDRLNNIIHGVQKATYYTIGGESGTGKSTLALQMFVYNPFIKIPDPSKLKILFLSMEMPKQQLAGKLCSRYLFDNYGIVADIAMLFSRGNNNLDSELYKSILETKSWFDSLEDSLFIIDNQLKPNAIYAVVRKFVEKYGVFKEVKKRASDGFEYTQLEYIENDPEQHLIVILDHAGKISGDYKSVIDEVSNSFIWFMNKCGITPVMVNQLNRSTTDQQRLKMGHIDPKLSDWKDTNNVIEDCSVAISIYNAHRAQQRQHHGYDITSLRDRYRSIGILKNRFGEADKFISTAYYGEVCKFVELPRTMAASDYEAVASMQL